MDSMVADVLAVIPARGGSKGIPGKNIRDFAGHPLIAYSIAAARQAEMVTRVIVSTDDEEIAAIARRYGAETPFLRPAELAQDHSPDLPLFQHALNWLAEHEDHHPDAVVQLRPTSPFRPPTLVDEAVRLLMDHPDATSVRGVVPAGQNPHKMWRVDPQTNRLQALLTVDGIAEPYNAPRQQLPQVYWQTGHIDVIRPHVIISENTMSGSVILPVILDPRYTVDIDTLFDWQWAEWMVHNRQLEMVHPDHQRRPLPEKIDLLVLDFDGVLTDNRVWVDETGREMIAAYRSDSMGLNHLRKAGIETVVISTETNPVVNARCQKMRVPVFQGVNDKASVLKDYLQQKQITPDNTIFVGNDINDVPCFPIVGCAVAVADAQPAALQKADMVLTRRGGHGAVREMCDKILNKENL